MFSWCFSVLDVFNQFSMPLLYRYESFTIILSPMTNSHSNALVYKVCIITYLCTYEYVLNTNNDV